MRSEDVLEMATLNGVRALVVDHLVGSIEVGKRADILVLDYRVPHLYPLVNPISHVVYVALSSDVKHVIADGKLVMFNRVVPTLDEGEIIEEAEKRARDFYSRAGVCFEPKSPVACCLATHLRGHESYPVTVLQL